jgi:hypothetical protein
MLKEYECARRGADTSLSEEGVSQIRHKMELEEDIAHGREKSISVLRTGRDDSGDVRDGGGMGLNQG